MRAHLSHRCILSLLLLWAGQLLYGCHGAADSRQSRAGTTATPQPQRVIQEGPQPVATLIDARPAAMVNGKTVTWGELRPALNEMAGGQALQDLILDRKINELLAGSRLTIAEDDVAAERKALLESLSADPNIAMAMLDDWRDRQNMGRIRFEALMRRNAGLRTLVRKNVKITEQSLREMREMVHGEKRQGRMISVPDLKTAESAINLIKGGTTFADAAAQMSTDSSAARSGLLDPISRVDPACPEAVRQALWTLNPGEMSGPLQVGDHYVIVMLVKRIAGDGIAMEEARPALERLARMSQEQVLMDQLSRTILADTSVNIFDESLNESWARNKRSGTGR